MARVRILALLFTDEVKDKLRSHGLTPDQAQSILLGPVVLKRNRAGRTAPFVLLGRDEQGRCLAIPVVPSPDPIKWWAITGWYCKPSEAAILRGRRGIMDEPRRYDSTEEPLADEERELMDPDYWDWDTPIDVIVSDDPLAGLVIDLTYEEHRAIGEAARSQGLGAHAYIKQAALAAARADNARIEASPGTPRAATG